MRALVLSLDLWRLSCSGVPEHTALEAVSRAAEILKPCGISLELGRSQVLDAKAEWCRLPATEKERRPLLEAIGSTRRLLNPRGLSLFILPQGGAEARYSFAVIDKSRRAGCGQPSESRFLTRFGGLFMTDFSFMSAESGFSGLLLAHEAAHALTMRSHPTADPHATLLADHLADLGPQILPQDCACMRSSPYLRGRK